MTAGPGAHPVFDRTGRARIFRGAHPVGPRAGSGSTSQPLGWGPAVRGAFTAGPGWLADRAFEHPLCRLLLQQHDPTLCREASRHESREDDATVERETRTQRLSGGRKCAAIRCSVRHQEDDQVQLPVAPLACDPPVHGLDVAQPRLGLDSHCDAPGRYGRVPCSWIARDRERDLGAPGETWPGSVTQSGEKANLGDVSDRVGTRIGSEREIEADRGADPRQERQAGSSLLAALDPTDGRVRDAGRGADESLAEAGIEPSLANLVAQGQQRTTSKTIAAIRRTLSSRHRAEPWRDGLHWQSTAGRMDWAPAPAAAAEPRACERADRLRAHEPRAAARHISSANLSSVGVDSARSNIGCARWLPGRHRAAGLNTGWAESATPGAGAIAGAGSVSNSPGCRETSLGHAR